MISPPLRHNSPELVCLHEAGHVAAALLAEAHVVEVELYSDQVRAYGRTRTQTTDFTQRIVIALGGFAVEWRLWLDGQIIDFNGAAIDERSMIQLAYANAAEDVMTYQAAAADRVAGLPQRDIDLQFMVEARNLGQNFPMPEIVKIASALLESGRLDAATILALWNAA